MTAQARDGSWICDHDTLVAFSKSWGLFYLIAFAIGVCIYTFWPSNRKRFDEAKTKHPRSGRRAMAVEERDSVSGHETTGHEWNGIKELDTPVPRGVLIFLIVTHVLAVDLVVSSCRPGPWERLTPKAGSAPISARWSRQTLVAGKGCPGAVGERDRKVELRRNPGKRASDAGRPDRQATSFSVTTARPATDATERAATTIPT